MRKLVVGNWKMNGVASSRAEIEALKGVTGSTACDTRDTIIARAKELVG